MATRYLTSNYRAAGSYNAVRARSVDADAVWALPGRLDTSLTGLRYMIGHDLDQTSMSCEWQAGDAGPIDEVRFDL